ncbi:MAG: hypothetical protein AAGL66_05025 [Pseudomonadota bacterium]
MTLVINRENGRQQLLVPGLLQALTTCTRFDTVDGHARRLCEEFSNLAGQFDGVRKTLEKLRKDGFFLEASTVATRLNESTSTQRAPARVFIMTCDRPASLDRLLESMLGVGGLTSYEGIWLVDDSRSEENQLLNQDAIERFNIKSAASISYFGPTEQAELLDRLIEAEPDHETGLRFLLDRRGWEGQPTYGRSRTLCLLLSVGTRAIMMDDDILCRAIAPAVPEEGIAVGQEHGREASFFSDRESMMGLASQLPESPLDLHERYLGSSLGETLRGLGDGPFSPEQLASGNAAMTNVWRAGSPVLITQCGAWGDPGTSNVHWALELGEFSTSRLLSAPQGVTAAIENRCVWLGSPRPTIIKMAYMSQMTGVDNSALLPPYFPAFRGEDLLFASMVEAMHPKAAVLEQGFAVPHLPEDRAHKTLREPIATVGSVALFAAYLTSRIDYTDANEAEERLAMLASDFRRLAAKSTHDLLLDYRREVAKAHALTLYRLTEQRRRTQDMNSANWTGYLDRGISEMHTALQREWSPADIGDTPKELSAEQAVEGFRGFLLGFASALEGWVQVREAAVRLAP